LHPVGLIKHVLCRGSACENGPVFRFGAKKAPGRESSLFVPLGKERYCKKAGSTVYPMKEVVT
jgi:hypothetical protein